MSSIMEELYNGNIQFDGRCHRQDSPFVQAARLKHDSLENLMETLNNSEKELFDQFCVAQGDIEDIMRYDTFTRITQNT